MCSLWKIISILFVCTTTLGTMNKVFLFPMSLKSYSWCTSLYDNYQLLFLWYTGVNLRTYWKESISVERITMALVSVSELQSRRLPRMALLNNAGDVRVQLLWDHRSARKAIRAHSINEDWNVKGFKRKAIRPLEQHWRDNIIQLQDQKISW